MTLGTDNLVTTEFIPLPNRMRHKLLDGFTSLSEGSFALFRTFGRGRFGDHIRTLGDVVKELLRFDRLLVRDRLPRAIDIYPLQGTDRGGILKRFQIGSNELSGFGNPDELLAQSIHRRC